MEKLKLIYLANGKFTDFLCPRLGGKNKKEKDKVKPDSFSTSATTFQGAVTPAMLQCPSRSNMEGGQVNNPSLFHTYHNVSQFRIRMLQEGVTIARLYSANKYRAIRGFLHLSLLLSIQNPELI